MFKREFSWSFSRYRLFKRCRLAYYFHYYASWGGWDKFSDDKTRKIYLLKNLKKFNNWIEDIFRISISEALINQDYDSRHIKRKAFARLKNDFCELRNSSWKDDPKKINLFEVYYKTCDMSDIFPEAEKELDTLFANFAEKKPHISDIPYLNLKIIKKPSSFNLEDVKVWCSPDILFENKNEIIVIGIFFRDPCESGEWAFKMAVDALYAESRWPGKRVEKISQFLHRYDYPNLDISRNIEEVRSIIQSSSSEMLKLTALDTEIKEEVFQATDKKDQCHLCLYKELCRDNINLN